MFPICDKKDFENFLILSMIVSFALTLLSRGSSSCNSLPRNYFDDLKTEEQATKFPRYRPVVIVMELQIKFRFVSQYIYQEPRKKMVNKDYVLH